MAKRKPSKPAAKGPGQPKSQDKLRPAPPDAGQEDAAASRLTTLVLTVVGLLGLLHLVTSFVPSIRTWGIDYWSEFPVIVRLGLVVLLGLTMTPGIAAQVDRRFSAIIHSRWAPLAGMALLGVLFVVFQSRGYAYGDGYSFMAYFTDGKLPALDAHLATQFMDLFAHWALYRFILMPLGGTVALSYALLGAAAGVLALWAIGRIAAALTRDHASRRFVIAMAVTSGAMILWFGHVESYTLVNAAALWMIAFVLDARNKKGRIWAAWGMWILALSLHQLALAFLPALVWAHWRTRKTGRPPFDTSTSAALFGGGFLVWAVATFLQRQIGIPVFVPIYSMPDTLYSAFSVQHLIDALNLILFLAPVGLVGLAAWPMKNRQDKITRIVAGLVGVMAAWAWYFAFWIDPLIGAFRDWDLLAAFAFPLSLWAGVTVVNRFPNAAVPRWLWVPVAALGVMHAGAFVGSVQNEVDSALRVDRLVHEDVHYTAEFFAGTRLPPWAAIIGRTLGRYDLARDHLSLRVQIDPTDALAWANLGNAYRRLQMADSSLICYREASDRDTTNEKYANNLGVLYTEERNWEGAAYAFERAAANSDTGYAALSSLGLVYINLSRFDDARAKLDKAIAMRPNEFSAYYNRGLLEEILADTAAAIANYEEAVKHIPGADDIYTRLVQLYQWSGRPLEAINVAKTWEKENPESRAAVFLMGTCYYMLDDNENSLRAFEKALRIKPDDALICYYIASIYRKMGQLDVAMQFAQKSASLDRNLALPYLEQVYIAADQGDREAAVRATHEYLTRSPGDSGMAYLQQFLK